MAPPSIDFKIPALFLSPSQLPVATYIVVPSGAIASSEVPITGKKSVLVVQFGNAAFKLVVFHKPPSGELT